MNCPFEDCGFSGTRMVLHQHLVDEHGDAVEREDATTYVLERPDTDGESENEIKVRAEAGVEDETLERFSREVRMLAFDKLLDRIEESEKKEES